MKKLATVIVTALLLAGCVEPAARSYLGDITVGESVYTNGVCLLPLDIPTRMVHSAQWVYKVKSNVEGTNLFVTAHITKPPFLAKQSYPGTINLGAINSGNYSLFYRDPQGVDHPLGTVTVASPDN
jgi:hypothetical protein